MIEIDEVNEELTIEDIRALWDFLSHQYISYENLTLLETVRKISRIIETHELALRNSSTT